MPSVPHVPRPQRPAGPRRRAGIWPDVALAVLLSATGQLELSTVGDAGTFDLAHGLLLLGQTLPVAIMRVAPATAVSVGMAATLLEALTVVPSNTLSGLLAPLLLIYFLSRRTTGRRLMIVTALVAITLGLHIVRRPGFEPSDLAFAYILSGAVLLAGRYVRHRELDRIRAEHEAAAVLAAAVADERGRIARELHDVVAHGMGVMVVQAAAAEQLLHSDPDLAREPLANVREAGQGALAEMRRLLGLLRDGDVRRADEDETESRIDQPVPQPNLEELPALTDRLRQAGMDVSLTMTGDVGVAAPGLQLAAYRIVQEALTNALKHSGGAPTNVSVDCAREGLTLLVRNTAGRPLSTSTPDGAGHGLIGMQERARLYRGRLEAGPQPDGTFLVHAVLPTQP